MSENNSEGVGEALNALHLHEKEVLYKLFADTKDKPVQQGDIHVVRAYGNPSAHHFCVTNSVDGVQYSFNARYYKEASKIYPGKMTPPEKDVRAYNFLNSIDSCFLYTPRAVCIESAPAWIFTETVEGTPLGKVLDGQNYEEKISELQRLFSTHESFMARATKKARQLDWKIRNELFASRRLEDQIKDYLEACAGGKTLGESIVENYITLFGDAIKGDFASHGDFSRDNVLKGEKGKFYILDPELKFRNEFSDVGNFLSYEGKIEDREIYSLAKETKIAKIKALLESEGMKFVRQKLSLSAQGRPKSRHFIRGNMIQGALRTLAKIAQGKGNREVVGQRTLVYETLKEYAERPEFFGKSPEDGKRAEAIAEAIGIKETDSTPVQ